MSRYHVFSLKMEKITYNNCLRVEMTSDHINMDMSRFSGPKNIRRSVLLGDLVKVQKFKIAAAAI